METLAENLRAKGEEYFSFVSNEFPVSEEFQLCLQKLIYPYSYMDSFEKFNEPIPSIEHFYNDLNEEELDQEEYKRLQETCIKFGITNLGQLHDLYLKIDVCLLASVFEFYRIMGLEEYGLDPAFYISAPSFSWDAMLLNTNVELELLQDRNLYTFFEKGRRGTIFVLIKSIIIIQMVYVAVQNSKFLV